MRATRAWIAYRAGNKRNRGIMRVTHAVKTAVHVFGTYQEARDWLMRKRKRRSVSD